MTSARQDDGEQRVVIDCPRCEKGTVKQYPNQNPMWWEVQHLRCSWCGGTGRIYADDEGVA